MRACVCFYKKIDFFFEQDQRPKTHHVQYST